MKRASIAAAICAAPLAPHLAQAHAVAGARVFPVTLTIDDPGVADEASIPTFSVQRQGASGDLGLPDFFNRLTPLVEIAWSSPASKPTDLGTQLMVSPGVLYEADWFQIGIEALIPANRASGRNVGVITQFQVFFDDLFPNSLGKPLFGR